MNRPVGVTILAILDYLFAVLLILGGIGMIVGGGIVGSILGHAAGPNSGVSSSGMAGLLAGMGAVAAVGLFIAAAICGLLGWGLWSLKNWARIVTIVLMAIDVVFAGFGILGSLIHFQLFTIVWSGFWLAIYGLIIWYLLQPNVKAAFTGGQRTMAATA